MSDTPQQPTTVIDVEVNGNPHRIKGENLTTQTNERNALLIYDGNRHGARLVAMFAQWTKWVAGGAE